MGYLEGVKTGAALSPWSAVLREVNNSYDRRRKEEAERAAEEQKLTDLFRALAKKDEYETSQKKLQSDLDIEKEYVKGEIEGTLRPRAMAATPMGAVGQAMQPQQTTIEQVAQPQIAFKSPSGKEYERTNYEKPEDVKRNLEIKKLQFEEQERNNIQNKKSEMVLEKAQDSLKTISEIENNMDYFGTFGNIWPIPGTPKKTWAANVDKLLADKVLKTIMEMKEASKTGATGFGQLNIKELETLQNASTALKKDLPKADAQRYINDMKASLQKIINEKGGNKIGRFTIEEE